MANLELDDIQSIVGWGHGHLRAATFVLLALEDPAAARQWLGSQVNTIPSAQGKPETEAKHVAFTASGLRSLGFPQKHLSMFSREFIEGMVSPHRTRILADVGESAPEEWAWGSANSEPVDVLFMLYSHDEPGLARLYADSAATFATSGMRQLQKLDGSDIGDSEHFGFRDGISQPAIAGLGRSNSPQDTIATGEFLLGYRNEYRLYTERPMLETEADPQRLLPADESGSGQADFGRNGSYLVFRQLRQDVRGFRNYLEEVTRRDDGAADPEASVRLGAKMMGRWPSGAPLVLAPEKDNPELATYNDFAYHRDDPYGLACPIGAHARRNNPRDSLVPSPGTDKSIAINKRHRILRRGRAYGPRLGNADSSTGENSSPEPERGLYFICLNANLSRQFEFIHHTWANNPNFEGLYDNADPFMGGTTGVGRTFSIPAKPFRQRVVNLPEFVTVRGGAYFFLPGIRAIRYLASLPG